MRLNVQRFPLALVERRVLTAPVIDIVTEMGDQHKTDTGSWRAPLSDRTSQSVAIIYGYCRIESGRRYALYSHMALSTFMHHLTSRRVE